jgi:hypothetical protein
MNGAPDEPATGAKVEALPQGNASDFFSPGRDVADRGRAEAPPRIATADPRRRAQTSKRYLKVTLPISRSPIRDVSGGAAASR